MPHQIEVDDEVMAALKARAEAFVDTPNSVLRRLLLDEEGRTSPGRAPVPSSPPKTGIVPKVKRGTPRALEHILQVAYLARGSSRTRPEATHEVARHHGVTFQTVLDKYSRQLNLSTDEFDELLAEPGLNRLKRLLRSKFDPHRNVIADVLG